MDKIIFKVNDLKNGNGYVNRISTFIKNLNNFRSNYHEDLKKELKDSGKEQIVKFESAGKYVVLIEMKKDWDVISMVFFDLKKEEMKAKGVVESLLRQEKDEKVAEDLSVDFLFAFLKNKMQYDENYTLVELELDSSEFN